MFEPFHYEFMRAGLYAAIIVGTTCAFLGAYVVLRRMAFIGDALAHSALPGLVGAYLLGFNLLAGAIVAGVLTSLGIGKITNRKALREDTAIGILFTGMFALGIVMMSNVHSYRCLSHMLFGNILGVTDTDLIIIASVALLVLVSLVMLHKEFELTSCDPAYAETIGMKPGLLRYALLILLALAVVTGIQAVGVVLISALLVTPAATAAMFTHSLARMMLIAAAFAIGSSIAGLYASYYLGVSSGAAIVLCCTALFYVTRTIKSLLFKRPRGLHAGNVAPIQRPSAVEPISSLVSK